MKNSFDGYIRVAAATPQVRVADCDFNSKQIAGLMEKASDDEVRLICFPELCITGYTCGDLFLQDTLLREALAALSRLARESARFPLVAVVGLPFLFDAKLYNAAAVLCGGKVLGFVPKSYIPNYGEFYEARHFSPAPPAISTARFDNCDVPFGTRVLFKYEDDADFCVAAEICEDLWIPSPPSASHAMAGATVIVNLSASDEVIGKASYRKMLASSQSGRLVCAYLYASAGRGESSTDMVFAGHNLICENGAVLSESLPFGDGWSVADIDLRALAYDRRRMSTWHSSRSGYEIVKFSHGAAPSNLRRYIDPHPFVPRDERERNERCEAIIEMQVAGLEKRLLHTSARTAVIGVSGGLDSSLALLVTERAMRKLGRPPSDVAAVTMPCFGTTERTK
ncbi:MAG: NAD(+) synthase, partial [Synergistaceae bacterium]|nr:NAD(+) synthase [Synergistaceae bacterium]